MGAAVASLMLWRLKGVSMFDAGRGGDSGISPTLAGHGPITSLSCWSKKHEITFLVFDDKLRNSIPTP